MFCVFCGKPRNGQGRFCRYCGKLDSFELPAAEPAAMSSSAPPPTPVRADSKSTADILIGIGLFFSVLFLFEVRVFFETPGWPREFGEALGNALVWAIVPLIWRKSRTWGILALAVFVLKFAGQLINSSNGDENAHRAVESDLLTFMLIGPAVAASYCFLRARRARRARRAHSTPSLPVGHRSTVTGTFPGDQGAQRGADHRDARPQQSNPRPSPWTCVSCGLINTPSCLKCECGEER